MLTFVSVRAARVRSKGTAKQQRCVREGISHRRAVSIPRVAASMHTRSIEEPDQGIFEAAETKIRIREGRRLETIATTTTTTTYETRSKDASSSSRACTRVVHIHGAVDVRDSAQRPLESLGAVGFLVVGATRALL